MFNEWQSLADQGISPEYAMPTLLGVALDAITEAGYKITPPLAEQPAEVPALPISSIKGHHAQLTALIKNVEEGQIGLGIEHAQALAGLLQLVLNHARQS